MRRKYRALPSRSARSSQYPAPQRGFGFRHRAATGWLLVHGARVRTRRRLFLLLHREKPLAAARAVKIALQVANALISAHAAGVVHRDLKPDNIMLIERDGDSEFVKVVDFGIAKVAAPSGPVLTALGSVFGTPEYMAPEQARGAEVDSRTDLYTLATVLYEMLTGRTPFAHEQFAQVLMGQISKPPPPLPPEIDGELASLVMQLLEKEPSKRVQTATELFARLHAILSRLSPHHPTLAEVPAGQAMPASPSAPQLLAQPPPPPSAPLPSVAFTAPAPVPSLPISNPTPPPATRDVVGKTQRPLSIGCALGLVFLAIVAFAVWRWVASMY